MSAVDEMRAEVLAAISSASTEHLDAAVQALLAADDHAAFVELLNQLLVTPGHLSHQQVARALQKLRSPSSVAFVERALEGGFDYLEYTCSEPDAIAKWFSWLLFDIGTPQAIDVLRRFAESSVPEIRGEMRYRLAKFSR